MDQGANSVSRCVRHYDEQRDTPLVGEDAERERNQEERGSDLAEISEVSPKNGQADKLELLPGMGHARGDRSDVVQAMVEHTGAPGVRAS